MPWIKIDHATPDKPEVWTIAAALGITPEEAIGRLLRVWIWADQQSRIGHALSVTGDVVDAIARCNGFANAMRKAGWLCGVDGAIELPNLDRHSGESAKSRALAAERQRRARARNSHAVVTPPSRSSVTREEKRKKKKETPPVSPSSQRGMRLSSDWSLPADWRRWAIEQGLDERTVDDEAGRFADYWRAQAGVKGRKADWAACWRNWVRRGLEYRGANGGDRKTKPAAAAFFDTLRDYANGKP